MQELDSLIQGGVSSFEDYGKQLQARIEDATPESVLGEAGALAKGALDGVAAPFDIFSGDWFLNICFFSVVSILLYSLIIAAPRQ